jgi:hypothetical protein
VREAGNCVIISVYFHRICHVGTSHDLLCASRRLAVACSVVDRGWNVEGSEGGRNRWEEGALKCAPISSDPPSPSSCVALVEFKPYIFFCITLPVAHLICTEFNCFSIGSRESAVAIATGCGLGIRVPVEARFLSSAYRPDRFWGPPSLISKQYWELFPRDKAAEAWSWSLQLVPRSIHGSIELLPHKRSRRSAELLKNRDFFYLIY